MKLHFKRLYGDDSFVINEDKTIIIKLDGEKYPDFNASLETLALIENIVELHLPNCKHISGHRVSGVGPVRKERVGVGMVVALGCPVPVDVTGGVPQGNN